MLVRVNRERENLDARQDGEDGGGDAEQHVDADEDFVLCAAVRVSVVHVEQHQGHRGQHVVHRGNGQQSFEHRTQKYCDSSEALPVSSRLKMQSKHKSQRKRESQNAFSLVKASLFSLLRLV